MAGEYVPSVRGCRGQIRTEKKTIDTKKESATCTKAGGRFLFLNSFRSVNDPRAIVPEMIQLPEPAFFIFCCPRHVVHSESKGGSTLKKQQMFENYPDVVEVDDLRVMLGGISKKLAYRLLAEREIRSVKVGRTYKIPKICIIEYLMGEEMCHINIS